MSAFVASKMDDSDHFKDERQYFGRKCEEIQVNWSDI